MKQHNFLQGSEEWLEYRRTMFNASDAPAMLGKSPYKTRSKLLDEMATGFTQDIDASTQRIFDAGHRYEALARPLAEAIIGEDLFPVTGSSDKLSASFDGLTMSEDIAWEHKTLNDAIRNTETIDDLRIDYRIQMEQQLYVSGAKKCLFTATKWNDLGELLEEKHFWYESNEELREKIISGWAAFKKAIECYEAVEIAEKPIAEPTESLPSVSIRVDGGLSVISNLDLFGAKLREFVGNLTKDPQDDQDFANLEQAVKDLKKAEEALENSENMALAQISDVNDMRRTVADLKEIARSHRLTSEKLVKSQKEVIKLKILSDIKEKFNAHIVGLQAEIKGVRLDIQIPDFAGSMKNKRTIASLHEAVDTLLANSKIEADRVAKDLREKHTWCKDASAGFGFLFNDIQIIITSNSLEAFQAIVNKRIDDHKKAEAERLEAEREKMCMEEEAKAAAKVKAEQDRIEAEKLAELERLERENQKILEQETAKKFDAVKIETVPEKQAEVEHIVEQLIDTAKTQHKDKPFRPTPDQLAHVIASHYKVSTDTAIDWIVAVYNEITEAA